MNNGWIKLGLVIAVVLCLLAWNRINSDKKRIARLEAQIDELEIRNKACNDYTVDEVYDDAVDEVYNETSQSAKDISKSTNTQDYVGEYEFTDRCDKTFHFELNSDMTVQLTKDGLDRIYYGYWETYFKSGFIRINFSDYDHLPYVCFPSGNTRCYMIDIPIGASFVYTSCSAIKANDPNCRLVLDKIDY